MGKRSTPVISVGHVGSRTPSVSESLQVPNGEIRNLGRQLNRDLDRDMDTNEIMSANFSTRDPKFGPIGNSWIQKLIGGLRKYVKFIGPGLLVSVAYIDPGNYSAAVAAGAGHRFTLLFILLLSNLFAIFLQSLCIKLGSVTGLDLARACRDYLPRWLSLIIYVLAEVAIIATDVAEVIGSAIALNILLKIPLPAGVCLTVVDVLFVLMAYRPGSSMKFVRIFEYVVAALVFGVVICFAIELSRMPPVSAREVFRGFAPSKEMFNGNGAYVACSLLGATVMPHSLYLGSGLVQPRLREFDVDSGYIRLSEDDKKNQEESFYAYRPTIYAIKYALKYSIIELAVTLFTLALFVNCSILIVSGATLSGTPNAEDADLYTIHNLLSSLVAPAVGTVFMLALLMSGQSAGIVCTIAGQMVSEGFLNWTVTPWIRRIITRSIAILPCLAISVSIGKNGLGTALNASQVILSVLLPFLTAPLIYFTCRTQFMKVKLTTEQINSGEFNNITHVEENNENADIELDNTSSNDHNLNRAQSISGYIDMSNNWITGIISILIWGFISGLNIYMIVMLAMGKS